MTVYRRSLRGRVALVGGVERRCRGRPGHRWARHRALSSVMLETNNQDREVAQMAWVEKSGAQTWRVRYRREDGTIGAINGFTGKTSGP